MGLKGVVDSLDSIEEGHRKLYVPGEGDYEGKFVLDAEVEDHPATKGLKSTREKEKQALLKYKRYGKPEELQARLDRLKELEDAAAARGDDDDDDDTDDDDDDDDKTTTKGKGKGKGGADERARLKRLRDRFEREKAEAITQAEELAKQAVAEKESLQVSVKQRRAMAGKVREELQEDVEELTRKEFKVIDGEVVHVDEDGEPDGLSIEKFYDDVFRKRRPDYYKSREASGAGTKGSARHTGGGARRGDDDKRSSVDKIRSGLDARS